MAKNDNTIIINSLSAKEVLCPVMVEWANKANRYTVNHWNKEKGYVYFYACFCHGIFWIIIFHCIGGLSKAVDSKYWNMGVSNVQSLGGVICNVRSALYVWGVSYGESTLVSYKVRDKLGNGQKVFASCDAFVWCTNSHDKS